MNIRKLAIGLACLLCLQCMTQAITPERLRKLRHNFEELMGKDFSEIPGSPWFAQPQAIINELKTARRSPDILNLAETYQKQLDLKQQAWNELIEKEAGLFKGEKALKTVSSWEKTYAATALKIAKIEPRLPEFEAVTDLLSNPWESIEVEKNLVTGVKHLNDLQNLYLEALNSIAPYFLPEDSAEKAQWNETHNPQILVNTVIAQIKNYIAMLESTSRELGELGELRNWAKKNYPDKYQKFQQERIAQAPSKSN